MYVVFTIMSLTCPILTSTQSVIYIESVTSYYRITFNRYVNVIFIQSVSGLFTVQPTPHGVAPCANAVLLCTVSKL